MPTPSEFELQRAFHFWFAGVKWENGLLKGQWKSPPHKAPGVVGWHTPNGGGRHGAEAKRLKEMGVLAGIPDYFMLWGRLYSLEFKEPGGTGRLSDAQLALHPQLIAAGAVIQTVDNLAAAKEFAIRHGLAFA